jgi:TonB family protein
MTTPACERCGAPKAIESSAGGLCAACLLAVALDSPSASAMTDEDRLDDLAVGTVVAQFIVGRPLGRGGMGVVYEAQDTHLDRAVALKVLPPEFLHDQTFAMRFAAEARVIARLEHPNIVPIYATGIDSGLPWMSMRLLTGNALSAILERRRLAPSEIVQLLRNVAAALDYAHGRGVVHRDIKPANILLDRSGTACVADFGLARMAGAGNSLTHTGMVTGTPHYMAPEQALGRAFDHRCDIYSLGIVAYEMLAGTKPFTGASPVAVLLQHVREDLPAPAGPPSTSRWMDAVRKATAKDPAERWLSAGAFVEALAASLDSGAVDAAAATASVQRSAHRSRNVWAAVACGIVVAIAGLAWAVGHGPRAPLSTNPSTLASDPRPQASSPPSDASIAPGDRRVSATPVGRPSTRASEAGAPGRRPSADSGVDAPPSSVGVSAAESPADPPSTAATTRVDTPSILEPLTRPPGVTAPPPQRADVVTVPELIRRGRLAYPPVALAGELQGEVILEGLIGVDGKVSDIIVVRSVHPLLDMAARKAWSESLYKPALRNGTPESHRWRITFRFQPE